MDEKFFMNVANFPWILLQKNKKKISKFTAFNLCRAIKLSKFFLKINSILYPQIENYKSEKSSEICARIYAFQIELKKKLMKSLKNLLHFHRFQAEKIFMDIPLLLSFYLHPLKTNKYLSNSEILCLFYLHLYSVQYRDVIWKYYSFKCELFKNLKIK